MTWAEAYREADEQIACWRRAGVTPAQAVIALNAVDVSDVSDVSEEAALQLLWLPVRQRLAAWARAFG